MQSEDSSIFCDDNTSDITNHSKSDYSEKISDIHLQSPIRDIHRRAFCQPESIRLSVVDRLRLECPIDISKTRLDSEYIYGRLLSSVYDNSTEIIHKDIYTHYLATKEVVTDYVKTTLDQFNVGYSQVLINHVSKNEIRYQSLRLIWEEIRYLMQDMRGSDRTRSLWVKSRTPVPGVETLYVSSLLCLLQFSNEDTYWVLDYDQVMMLSDTIMSRCNVLTCLVNMNPGLEGWIDPNTLEEIYLILDECFKTYGNNSYKCIAKWEPCIIASMLRDHDELDESKRYEEWLVSELTKPGMEHMEYLYNHIADHHFSVHQYAELHGLYRHWGHPTVDETSGCLKVKEIAQNRPVPDGHILNKLTGCLKRYFVVSFINKHGRWPKLKYVDECLLGTPLHAVVKKQEKIFNFYSPEYPLEHWGVLRFGKELNFDYHIDFTDLLEDTACCVERDQIRCLYSSEQLNYKPGKPRTLRRVLLEALRRDTIDLESICSLVQYGNIPEYWKIVILHAKERELKITPRLFAMLVLEMRLYFCATEKNVSDHIFKYFPQQTMTLSEADLVKRLYNLTGDSCQDLNYVSPVVGVDFCSWNICWTFLSTFRIFEMIDDLFGTPGLYLNSHRFFESCLISLSSYNNPPVSLIDNPSGEIEECETLWYGHKGGLEGIRQKCWTLVTIALLLYVESETGLKSYIIGQGDNQLVKIIIPVPNQYLTPEEYLKTSPSEISKLINSFMDCMSKAAEKIGHKIKQEETWVSLNFVIYGKDMLYNGSYLAQSLKKISRLFPDVNNTYPNLHDNLSSIQSCGLNAAQKGFDIILPYVMSTTELIMEFSRHVKRLGKPMFNSNVPLQLGEKDIMLCQSSPFRNFLLLLSSDIGGIPVLPFLSFMYRGIVDPLTCYMTNLSYLLDSNILARKLYKWLEMSKYNLNMANPELLVANPYSVNLRIADMLSTYYKDIILDALRAKIRNQHLSTLFHVDFKLEDSELFKYLVGCKPCHPRVLHEIFRQTVSGVRLSFISKFSNTRTTQGLISGTEKPLSMKEKIRDTEIKAISFLINMYKSVISVKLEEQLIPVCPTILSQHIRNVSWSETTGGEGIQGVTVSYPSHQFHPRFIFQDDVAETSSKVFENENIIFMMYDPRSRDKATRRGPYPVYVGSTTREKMTGRLFKLPLISRPLEGAIRLCQIKNWVTNEENSFFQFFDQLIATRSDVDIKFLEKITPMISGGSVVHRLNDHCGKRGTFHTTRPNLTTHIYYSTDYLGRLSKGLENYAIHFQAAIHLGFTLYQLKYNLTPSDEQIPEFLILEYNKCACEEKLDDVQMTNDRDFPLITVCNENPLIYAELSNSINRPGPSHDQLTIIKLVRISRNQEFNQTHAALALAHILYKRIIQTSNVSVVGTSEFANPLSGTITVADILTVSLASILEQLALLLFLTYPSSRGDALAFYYMIDSQCFYDIAQMSLIPEVYSDFCHLANMSPVGTADCFFSSDISCTMVKQIVGRFLMRYHDKNQKDDLSGLFSKLIYFPSSGIGAHRILSFWSKSLDIETKGKFNCHDLVSRNPIHKSAENREFYSDSDLLPLVADFISTYGYDVSCTLLKNYPIRISDLPPESTIRKSRALFPVIRKPVITRRDKGLSKSLSSSTILIPVIVSKYPIYVKCPVRSSYFQNWSQDIYCPPEDVKKKYRADQQFRIFGNTSTTHLKISEIIIKEELPVKGSVVTIAEGEGSIARLLLNLGAQKVYYNSLLKKDKYTPQRSFHYVPGSLADHRDRIDMLHLTVMTGGDLTDPDVVTNIINYIKSDPHVTCVTCDAEMAGASMISNTLKVMKAWISICRTVMPLWGLFKSFMISEELMLKLVSAAQLLFKRVEIIVPTFSSNENHEYYILCREFNPVIELKSTIEQLHDESLYYGCMGIMSIKYTLSECIKMRIQDCPFQEKTISEVSKLFELCEYLSIEDNLIHNCKLLFGNRYPFFGDNVISWLEQCKELAYNQIMSLIAGTVDPYFGNPIREIIGKERSGKVTYHKEIEFHMGKHFLADLVIRILEVSDSIEVKGILASQFGKRITLNFNENNHYTLEVNDDVLSQLSLKSIWRIWGHRRWHYMHKCSVKW